VSRLPGLRRLPGMLSWILRNRLRAFEREWEYDMSYARALLDADVRAFLAFAKAQGMGRYRKDIPRDVGYAAGITAMLAEDCGPCTQLGVTMALREGMSARVLAAVVRGELEELSEDVRLGVEFARAVISHAPAADELRERIVATWGQRALVSLAFAITMSRVYPTLKYALGHGKACQRVVIAGQPVAVLREAT